MTESQTSKQVKINEAILDACDRMWNAMEEADVETETAQKITNEFVKSLFRLGDMPDFETFLEEFGETLRA